MPTKESIEDLENLFKISFRNKNKIAKKIKTRKVLKPLILLYSNDKYKNFKKNEKKISYEFVFLNIKYSSKSHKWIEKNNPYYIENVIGYMVPPKNLKKFRKEYPELPYILNNLNKLNIPIFKIKNHEISEVIAIYSCVNIYISTK